MSSLFYVGSVLIRGCFNPLLGGWFGWEGVDLLNWGRIWDRGLFLIFVV